MPLAVSPQVFQLFIGAVYGLMGLAVWTLAPPRRDPWPARWWALAALALGLSSVLTVGRQFGLPAWLGFTVVPALDTTAFVLRIQALRRQRGCPPLWPRVLAGLLAAAVVYSLCLLSDDRRLRLSCINGVLGLCVAVLAWQARQIWRTQRSLNAQVLWISEALLAAALWLRMVSLWFTHGAGLPGGVSWDFLLLFVVGTLAGIYSAVAFLGLMLDDLRAAELSARAARISEKAVRRAAERHADELRDLIAQRDALARERDHMLQLLAYAIRQPLHNAGSALQAAEGALQQAGGSEGDRAAERLQRARAVLDSVHTVLNQTLADAGPLLADAPPPAVAADAPGTP